MRPDDLVYVANEPSHIEPVHVVELFDTGVPSLIRSNGLEFHWNSWVLCVVKCHEHNPKHYVICTRFSFPGFHRQTGEAPKVTVTRWNPSYEDDEHKECVKLTSMYYWKPVSVVVLKP